MRNAAHRIRSAWIAALSALLAGATVAIAQSLPDRAEWPKTDFARRTVDLAEIQSRGCGRRSASPASEQSTS